MSRSNRSARWQRLLWVAVAMLLWASPAHAWGPATHYYLAGELLSLGLLSGALRGLLESRIDSFFYGNVIADVVVGKDLIDFEEHSHNWHVARRLRDRAEDDRARAFSLGYWTHLAADTVAHNIYVPHKILTTSSTRRFGHAYWELRADEKVPTEVWNKLHALFQQDFQDHNELLEAAIPRTVLPFSINHLVQRSLARLHSVESWQKLVGMVRRFSRYDLESHEIDEYHRLCLERMADSLSSGPDRDRVLAMDPTGGELEESMASTRKELKGLIAEGGAEEEVFEEAVQQLFPEIERILPDGD